MAEERFHIALAKRDGLQLTNATDGGDGAPGYRHRPETRERMSELKRGYAPSAQARAAYVAKWKGRPKSESHRAKISAAHKGRVKSPEVMAKIMKTKALNPWHPSPEQIAQQAAKLRGRPQTPGHVEKRIAQLRGSKLSAEARRAMSEGKAAKIRAAGFNPELTPALLKSARVTRGLRFNEAARIVGCCPGNVSLIEKGRQKPSIALWRRMVEQWPELMPGQ